MSTTEILREKALKLPKEPGVYIMYDKTGNIIYIGKSKALKNRVSQYFGDNKNHAQKVKKMVSQVADFQYILTKSEFEALVLECSLIKQHLPKYNILLKDDKGYSYIKITNELWPKIKAVKQKLNDSAEYIGPYTSSWAVKNLVDEVQKIFCLPDCNRDFSKKNATRRACLNYYIKQCKAPCVGKISQTAYLTDIKEALEFLRGGKAAFLQKLNEQMNRAAENLEFEKAASIRDRIFVIKKIEEKQNVVQANLSDQDVVALAQFNANACFEVFCYRGGRLADRKEFLLGDVGDPGAARAEFLERYYADKEVIPPLVILDAPTDDRNVLEEWLSSKAGRAVKIVVPQKGEKLKLVQICSKNASERLAQKIGRTEKETSALLELKELLSLSETPKYIEAYDISNLAGGENVAAMVVFENARPLKSAYRRFKIKSVAGQDDYASMKETILRRFEEYELEKDSGEGFGVMPDLILLDGGKGHVAVVKELLQTMGYDVPVYGMAKDNKHKTRAIAKDGGEIAITSKRQVFVLISCIQEEVHRFAIDYHRKLRKKNTLKNSLTNIPGIGEERAKILLRHFRSIERIKDASLQELKSIRGLTKSAALCVYNHFHGEK